MKTWRGEDQETVEKQQVVKQKFMPQVYAFLFRMIISKHFTFNPFLEFCGAVV